MSNINKRDTMSDLPLPISPAISYTWYQPFANQYNRKFIYLLIYLFTDKIIYLSQLFVALKENRKCSN